MLCPNCNITMMWVQGDKHVWDCPKCRRLVVGEVEYVINSLPEWIQDAKDLGRAE